MMLLPFHVLAGLLALAGGYGALATVKGDAWHRRSGVVFVGAMTVMALSGALIDLLASSRATVNVVAGLTTFYFVVTGWLTVRPLARGQAAVDRAGIALAIAVSALALAAGVELAGRGRPEAAPSFLFAGLGLLGAAGDVRMLRAGAPRGPRRLVRHLWRMCFAMWVAAASFFWGPSERVPEIIRVPALQAGAVLTPMVAMIYWRWKLRTRKRSGKVVRTGFVEMTQ